jgi:hypothetical protein
MLPPEPCYSSSFQIVDLIKKQQLSSNLKDDCSSIKTNSIYSSYRGVNGSCSSFSIASNGYVQNPNNHHNNNNGIVRSTSRSVFSIYEEEDDNCLDNPLQMGSNTTLTFKNKNKNNIYGNNNTNLASRLEMLNESDVRRIESMYR